MASSNDAPPQLSKLDMTLAILESQESPDYLNVAFHGDILGYFDKKHLQDPPPSNDRQDDSKIGASRASIAGKAEYVLLSSKVEEVTMSNGFKKQTFVSRVLIISNEEVYLFQPGSYKQPKSHMPIKSIESVVLAQGGDDFVIHFTNTTVSYWLRSHLRSRICRALNNMYGKDLHVEVTSTNLLTDSVQFKQAEASSVDATSPRAIPKSSSFLSLTTASSRRAGDASPSSKQNMNGGFADSLKKKIRNVVSKKKNRLKEDGYDLDLTYVKPNLIAMGYPSDDIEGIFRNPYSEVYRFLEERHEGHYKVYNLCSERRYDPKKFHGRVARYPFEDHNCPSLKLIHDFCKDVDAFVTQKPVDTNCPDDNANNVAAIHCKAGKGRTGLMVACYLLYSKQYATAQEALEFFGKARTTDGKGVTIPSQMRFVKYFERLLFEYTWQDKDYDFNMEAKRYTLTKIRLHTVPHFDGDGGSDPYFFIFREDGARIYDSRDTHVQHYLPSKTKDIVLTVPKVSIKGATKFVFYDQDQYSADDEMFGFWIDTSFLEADIVEKNELGGGLVRLSKFELDRACKDKKHQLFDEDFFIEVSLSQVKQAALETPSMINADPESIMREMDKLKLEAVEYRSRINELTIALEDSEREKLSLMAQLHGQEEPPETPQLGLRKVSIKDLNALE